MTTSRLPAILTPIAASVIARAVRLGDETAASTDVYIGDPYRATLGGAKLTFPHASSICIGLPGGKRRQLLFVLHTVRRTRPSSLEGGITS